MAWITPNAPRIRHRHRQGYYALVPGTSWGRTRFRYFTTEAEARTWAEATWCRRYARRTCPPILREELIEGNWHSKEFHAWYARSFHSGVRSTYIAEGAVHSALWYQVIPTQTVDEIPTDAWDAAALARTHSSPLTEVDPLEPMNAPASPSWLDRTSSQKLAYAGQLGDSGTVTPLPTERTVFACYGVDHDRALTTTATGQPWYPQGTTAVILWAPHPGQPSLPFDSQERDAARLQRYLIWGVFPTWASAQTFAYDLLAANWLEPRVSRDILTLDWHQRLPLALDPATERRAQHTLGTIHLRDALNSLASLWTAAPLTPEGPWGVFRFSPEGRRQWLQTSDGSRFTVDPAQVQSPAFTSWCARHDIRIASPAH